MSFPLASNTPNPISAFGSEKALQTQFGAVSPLWFAYAGLAGAGVAYWWMTRWIRPFNIEAVAAPIALSEPGPAPVQTIDEVEPARVIEAAAVEAAAPDPAPAPVAETVAPDPAPAIEPAPVEAVIEPVAPVVAAPKAAAPKPTAPKAAASPSAKIGKSSAKKKAH